MTKPPLHWTPGEEPRQGDYECDVAALCGWLRCAPQSRYVAYDKLVSDCFDLHRARILPVLDAAVDHDYIKGYRRFVPTLPNLKATLLSRPLILTMDFFPSFYAWQAGPLSISGLPDGHHSWLVRGLNYNKKFAIASSWWGTKADYKFPFDVLKAMFARKDEHGTLSSVISQPYL